MSRLTPLLTFDTGHFLRSHFDRRLCTFVREALSPGTACLLARQALLAASSLPAFGHLYFHDSVNDSESKPRVVSLPDIRLAPQAYAHYLRIKEPVTGFFDDLDLSMPDLNRVERELAIPYAYRRLNLAGSISSLHSGVGYHADDKDVVLFQVRGSRHWRVWAPEALDDFEFVDLVSHQNTVKYPRRNPAHEPIVDVQLEAGDMLFLPAGHPHVGYTVETKEDMSISLSWSWFSISSLSMAASIDNTPRWTPAECTAMRHAGAGRPLPDMDGCDKDELIQLWADHGVSTLPSRYSRSQLALAAEAILESIYTKRQVF